MKFSFFWVYWSVIITKEAMSIIFENNQIILLLIICALNHISFNKRLKKKLTTIFVSN